MFPYLHTFRFNLNFNVDVPFNGQIATFLLFFCLHGSKQLHQIQISIILFNIFVKVTFGCRQYFHVKDSDLYFILNGVYMYSHFS